MRRFQTVVIGGGAAGIVAAISAARRGSSVVICEKTPRFGKKILASGNGRCNLSNEDLAAFHYNAAAQPLVSSIFSGFGKKEINAFFAGLGLRRPRFGGTVDSGVVGFAANPASNSSS